MRAYILKFSAVVCTVLLIVTGISTPSCKQPGDCTGIVTVYDTTGLPLAGVSVTLFHPGDTSKSYVSAPGNVVYPKPGSGPALTNSKGVVQFTIPLPAVYTVRAVYPGNSSRYILGVMILNNPGSTYNETMQF